MQHLLVDLYQICTYGALGVKTGLAPGGAGFTILKKGTKKANFKILLSQTGRGRALIFGCEHLRMNLYQVCSYHVLGVKSGSTPGVTSLNIGTKKTTFKILLF